MIKAIEVERESIERAADILNELSMIDSVPRELANQARMNARILRILLATADAKARAGVGPSIDVTELVPPGEADRVLAGRELLEWAARHALQALEDGDARTAMGYLRRALRRPEQPPGRPGLDIPPSAYDAVVGY